MTDTLAPATAPTVKEQGAALLSHAAGYASHRTITIGLRSGLLAELARAPGGPTPDELAERLDLDPFYVSVWCRAALSAGVSERDGDRYRFARTWPRSCSTGARRPMSAASSPCSSRRRCSAASRPAWPRASGCGGTDATRTGSPAWPGPAPPSTPGWSPAASSRCPAWPSGWPRAA